MATTSDIEDDYKEEIELLPPVNSRLLLALPTIELLSKPAAKPASMHTNRYELSPLKDTGTGARICLNSKDASDTLVARCQWSPDCESVCECDIQIALDPTLFDNSDKRVVWTGHPRHLAEEPITVNFYSSRLAGHTDAKSWEGPMFDFAIPHEVALSLYFDFACTEFQSDADGVPPQSDQSAAECNLRAVRIYVRVLVRQEVLGVAVSLPSDLTELTEGALLGFFSIQDRYLPHRTRRIHKDLEYAPVAVVIHVFANKKDFRGKPPAFDPEKSAHYVVGHSGEIWAYVREEDLAWHAGFVTHDATTEWHDYRQNRRGGVTRPKGLFTPNHDTIGIEHEGNEFTPWPLHKYIATAWLLQDMYTRWNRLELNRARIVPHNLFSNKPCPGPVIDMDRLIEYARGYRTRERQAGDPPVYIGEAP